MPNDFCHLSYAEEGVFRSFERIKRTRVVMLCSQQRRKTQTLHIERERQRSVLTLPLCSLEEKRNPSQGREQRRMLQAGGFLGDALAISYADEDGKTVAVAQGSRVRLLTAATGDPVDVDGSGSADLAGPLARDGTRVRAIRPSPSFSYIAACGGRYIATSLGAFAGPLSAYALVVQPLDFVDHVIVGLADNSVEEWCCAPSLASSVRLKRSECTERCLLFSLGLSLVYSSSCSSTIAAAGTAHRLICVWKPFDHEDPLLHLDGHGGCAFCCDISPTLGAVASAGEDRTVRLWCLQTGEELLTLYSHCSRAWVCKLLHMPRSQQPALAESGEDGMLYVWLLYDRMRRAREGMCVRAHGGRGTWAIAARMNCEAIATGGADSSVRTWSIVDRVDLDNEGSHGFRITAFAANGTPVREVQVPRDAENEPPVSELRQATGPVRPRDFALCPISGHLFISNQLWEVCEAGNGRLLGPEDGLENIASINIAGFGASSCCQCATYSDHPLGNALSQHCSNNVHHDVKHDHSSTCRKKAIHDSQRCTCTPTSHHRLCKQEQRSQHAAENMDQTNKEEEICLEHRRIEGPCILPQMLIACQDGGVTVAKPCSAHEQMRLWKVCKKMQSDIAQQRLRGAMWMNAAAASFGFHIAVCSKDGEASLRSLYDDRELRLVLGQNSSVMAVDISLHQNVAIAANRNGDIALFQLPSYDALQCSSMRTMTPNSIVRRAHGANKLEFLRVYPSLKFSNDGFSVAESGGRDGCIALYKLCALADRDVGEEALDLEQHSRERVAGLTTVRDTHRADETNALIAVCGFNRKEVSIVEPRSGRPFLHTTSNGVNSPAEYGRFEQPHSGHGASLSIVCVSGPEIHWISQDRRASMLQETTMLADRFHGYTIHTVALRRCTSSIDTRFDALTGAEDGSICVTRIENGDAMAHPMGQIAEHGVGAKVSSLRTLELHDEGGQSIQQHILVSGGSRGVIMCWSLGAEGSQKPLLCACRKPQLSRSRGTAQTLSGQQAGQQRNICAAALELRSRRGTALLAFGSSCGAVLVYLFDGRSEAAAVASSKNGNDSMKRRHWSTRIDGDYLLSGSIDPLENLQLHERPVLCCDACYIDSHGKGIAIVSGSTSGDVALWMCTGKEESHDRKGDCTSFQFSLLAQLCDLHQNGVNALAVMQAQMSTNAAACTLVVATAGDDQAVQVRVVRIGDSGPEVVALAECTRGHSSSVKGIASCFVQTATAQEELRIVTAGLDQRVKLWRPQWEAGALELLDSSITQVVDLQDLDVSVSDVHHVEQSVTACVVGRGLQTLTF